MLQISTPDKKIIPYHSKIINNYLFVLNNIHPSLKNFNPILSGSAAITFIFSPKSEYNDLDFYFSTEKDFNDASELLCKIETPIFTQNSHTFKNLNCQLIKKFFLPPEKLIYDHDFINSSVAIQNDKVFTSLDTFKCWQNNELSIRSFQLPEKHTPAEYLQGVFRILLRIEKYLKRYNFSLSFESINLLKEIKKYTEKNILILNNKDILKEKIINYYGQLVYANIKPDQLINKINTIVNLNNFSQEFTI